MSKKKGSKKSFSTGLESLFEYTLLEDNLQDDITVLTQEVIEETKKEPSKSSPSTKKSRNSTKSSSKSTKKTTSKTTSKTRGKTAAKSRRKTSSEKSFSDDLESFFQDSIDGVLDGFVTEVKRNIIDQGDNKQAIGIDVLLERTVQDSDEQTKRQRITFMLNSDHIDALKEVAKKEKRRMKSIVADLITEYLSKNKLA